MALPVSTAVAWARRRLWLVLPDLRTERQQARDEGRDLTAVGGEFDRLLAVPSDDQQETWLREAAELRDRVQALPFAASWLRGGLDGMVVALGLLYGGDDYERTITRAVMPGFDTDCNAATCGSLWGAMHGAGALPPKWTVDRAAARPRPHGAGRLPGRFDPRPGRGDDADRALNPFPEVA